MSKETDYTNLEKLESAVCDLLGWNPKGYHRAACREGKRTRKYYDVRCCISAAAYVNYGYTYEEIAKFYNKTRTNISRSLTVIGNLASVYPEVKEILDKVMAIRVE